MAPHTSKDEGCDGRDETCDEEKPHPLSATSRQSISIICKEQQFFGTMAVVFVVLQKGLVLAQLDTQWLIVMSLHSAMIQELKQLTMRAEPWRTECLPSLLLVLLIALHILNAAREGQLFGPRASQGCICPRDSHASESAFYPPSLVKTSGNLFN